MSVQLRLNISKGLRWRLFTANQNPALCLLHIFCVALTKKHKGIKWCCHLIVNSFVFIPQFFPEKPLKQTTRLIIKCKAVNACEQELSAIIVCAFPLTVTRPRPDILCPLLLQPPFHSAIWEKERKKITIESFTSSKLKDSAYIIYPSLRKSPLFLIPFKNMIHSRWPPATLIASVYISRC